MGKHVDRASNAPPPIAYNFLFLVVVATVYLIPHD